MFACEKADLWPVKALHGNPEYPVSQSQRCGFLEADVLEERADGREPSIARANAVLAVPFEVIEESENELSGEIFNCQIGRVSPELRLGECKEEPESIAIRADGAGTRLT